MNHAELTAQHVVETLIPGARMSFRSDQSQSTYDFDLYLPGGLTAVLEVTSAVDAAALATVKSILDRKRGGSLIPRLRCRNDWYISPALKANINRIRQHADAYLAAIESEGRTQFFSDLDQNYSTAVERIYEDLRVESGQVLEWSEQGYIGIGLPGQFGFAAAQDITDAVAAEIAKGDNQAKLASAGTAERHLFVYVDPFFARPHLALGLTTPEALPVLPPAITHMWVCEEVGQVAIVLRGSNHAQRWHRCEIARRLTSACS